MKNMKKCLLVLLAALLVLTAGTALAAKNGETVTVPISLNNSNGAYVKIRVSYPTDVFEYVSISCSKGQASGNTMVMADTSPISSGQCGTITLRIKANAPEGTYTVSASVVECWDVNEQSGSASASGGSVYVAGPCKHTDVTWSTTQEPTCASDGRKQAVCNACGEVTQAVRLPASDVPHTPGAMEETLAPTCTAAGKRVQKCTVCGAQTATESIAALGHDDGEWVTAQEATCKADGLREKRCTRCSAVLETEAISSESVAHTPGEMTQTTAPTCTEAGEETQKCTVCGVVLATESVPATGHTPGEMTQTTAPTCTEAGEKTQKCTACGVVLATEAVPATGHDQGAWVVTVPATCDQDGREELRCTRCAAKLDERNISAAGIEHTPGSMEQTTAPTCTEAGEKMQKCTVCDAVLATESVPATGHTPGEMIVTTVPTCTEAGEKTQKCTVCDAVLATEEAPAAGHDNGRWVTVIEPTRETEGLRERRCTACQLVLESEVLPVVTVIYYDMTVCSAGLRFRDMGVDTDEWYMFTLLDLTTEGEQVYDLIAGNVHKIGTVTVLVQDGTVTVTCELADGVTVDREFLTFLPGLSADMVLDLEAMTSYAFGTPIRIEQELGGDTQVLMLLCSEVRYNSENRQVTRFDEEDSEYQRMIEAWKLLLE